MSGPALSIVIASSNPGPVLAECLDALLAQPSADLSEIIVADSSTDGTAELIRERFPQVVLLHFDDRRSVPRLRGAGIAVARGRLIGLLDPYSIIQGDWAGQVMRIHGQRPEPAIGGSVALDTSETASLARWATYLYEYWEYVPPVVTGPGKALTGNNVSYKRAALGEAKTLEHAGFWKAFVNAQLLANGHALWTADTLEVRLRKPVPVREFVRSRYHHGRSYAAMRVKGASPLIRLARCVTSPLLPAVLLLRQVRGLWAKHHVRHKLFLTIPHQTAMHASWAWGELCGYLLGPGKSDDQLLY